MEEIKIIFEDPCDETRINLDEKINIIRPTKHNELKGLDYESSGHLGFASSEDLKNVVPKRLSTLPRVENTSKRTSILLYADDNGKSCSISVSDMLSKIIRTSPTIPDDLQTGEYVFLEKEE